MSDADARLQALYPHLGGSAAVDDAALLSSAREKSAESCRTQQAFFSTHAEALVAAARAIADVYAGGGRMFSVGNGGSSCDAAHFAVEFTHPVTVGRPSLPAVHLADDTALLTALANDVGYAEVFARRLVALAQPGDGLIAFSTSGNSESISRVLREAGRLGLTTLALLGGDGGAVRREQLAAHRLCVASDSIHRVQETHVATYHVLWDLVHTLLADRRGPAPR